MTSIGANKQNLVRQSAARMFLLLLVAIPLTGALLWGRWRTSEAIPEAPTHAYYAPPATPLQMLQLSADDREALLEVFWTGLQSNEHKFEASNLPDSLSHRFNTTVYATLYLPGQKAVRRQTRQPTLGKAAEELAREIRGSRTYQNHFSNQNKTPRLRMDILTHSTPLSVVRRHQFAALGLDKPFGVGARNNEKQAVFLPGDFTIERAQNHRDMLEAPMRRMDMAPKDWRENDTNVSLLQSLSFVNQHSAQEKSIALVRGLPLHEQRPSDCRGNSPIPLALFIARRQNSEGRYASFYNAATSMTAPNKSNSLHAKTTTSLLQSASRTNGDNRKHLLKTCRRSLAALTNNIKTISTPASVAFVEDTNDTGDTQKGPSLDATAWTLRAFCKYTQITSEKDWNDLIEQLARFLLFNQKDDGLFTILFEDPRNSSRNKLKHPSESSAQQWRRQAVCIQALADSYEILDQPALLVGVQKAIQNFHRHVESDENIVNSTRRDFLLALITLADYLPVSRYSATVNATILPNLPDLIARSQMRADDFEGGSLQRFPPNTHDTAQDLQLLAASLIFIKQHSSETDSFLLRRIKGAMRDAERFLQQFQFTEDNSYYLLTPSQTLGGVRRQPGSNLTTIRDAQAILRAHNLSTRAHHLMESDHDTQNSNQ